MITNCHDLISSNLLAPFRVDRETGDVIVTETLDYEMRTNYSFTVNVTDNGRLASMDSTVV